jgi:hypothetical protein
MADQLRSTNQQIIDEARRRQREQAARVRASAPIRAIDELISELEELHLANRKRVPDALEDRLTALNSLLPDDLRRELRSRVTIIHLMDELYELQDALLSRKAGLPPDDEGGDRNGTRLPQAS